MRKTIGFAAALALALGACGESSTPEDRAAPEANTADAQAPDANAMQAQLAALPEGQRNAVFIRAIRDSGGECQHVESSAEAGRYEGYPVWTARCTDRAFTIVIADDGSAQVLNEAEARLVTTDGTPPANQQSK
jgi:hypothetical protein